MLYYLDKLNIKLTSLCYSNNLYYEIYKEGYNDNFYL